MANESAVRTCPHMEAPQQALLEEVGRFADRSIEPRVERPEHPMSPPALQALLEEAEALGLAGSDDEVSGLAPWEELGTGEGTGGTLALLRRVARANAGVAWVLHQRALGRAIARRAALARPYPERLVVAPFGAYGLGRTSFARLMAGAPLGVEDKAILADVYGVDRSRVLAVEPSFGGLILPVWAPGDRLEWRLYPRDALEVTVHPNAHGLDELVTVEVRVSLPPPAPSDQVTDWRASAVEGFGAHQLASVAIAAGAVERAHRLARDYAAARMQGGATIDGHPAVQRLLGAVAATCRNVASRLDAVGRRPITAEALPDIFALRADCQPALTRAAHAAIQVFGGLGYMRDTGVEKVMRDATCLRVCAASPHELLLILAEWERLHA